MGSAGHDVPMNTIFKWLLRLVLLVAGLVCAASLLFAALLFLGLWALRAAWARLTGKPVAPFVWRVDARTGFGSVFRTRSGAAKVAEPGPTTPVGRRQLPDIEDVEVKLPRE